MTREEVLGLARIVAEVDGVPLLDPIRVEQRAQGARKARAVWAVFSHHNAPGKNAGFVIDDASRVVLSKQYVGFGQRSVAEFGGEMYSADRSILEREQWLPAQRSQVLQFFIEAGGLVGTGLPEIRKAREVGAASEWQVRTRGGFLSWTMSVDELRVGELLVETQLAGPFQRFRHLLTGLEVHGGTLVRERLDYRLRWGVLGELADPLLGLTRAIDRALEARYLAALCTFGPL